jgi:N-carbamoyl-L-amino-acid hydrolase
MRNIQIDSARLWASLMEMAQIGATEKGGVCRLTLTDLDRQSRDLFARWCEEAGCTVTVDEMGNMFARRPGAAADAPPVMAGSHLDSQPTGGKFDGAYGVLAGLEVIRTLNQHDVQTQAPVEVAVWTNEEGSRFSPAMMGSGVFTGTFDADAIRATTDHDGLTFGDELQRIGYAGEERAGEHPVAAYFEAHIEQGPILEAEETTIGVVTGGQGIRWYDVECTGQEAHAGPTPMPRRRDALVAAAQLVQEVNAIGHRFAPLACATVGTGEVFPNSRNVIPGRVVLTVDLRHPDEDILEQMETALRDTCETLARSSGVRFDFSRLWALPPQPFDPQCVDAVREGARLAGYSHRDIVSGAGHDAVFMAKVTPTGMIFIPCEDGISHNEIENASQEDCAAGCNVLLHAIMQTAGATG